MGTGNSVGEYSPGKPSINHTVEYNENIVVVGAEVHDKKPVNKLMFMAQAIRRVKVSSVQTVIYFKHGYSQNMISEFENSLKRYKKNIKVISIFNISQLFNYLNIGSIDKSGSDYRTRPDEYGNMYKVKNVYFYSHGMPSRITFMLDWDIYMKNNNIKSNETAQKNELNLGNYTILNPKSFSKDAELWSFACRTGLSVDNDSEVEKFTWGETESLAQKLAERLNAKVHAFLKRSNYELTWGGRSDRLDLKIADNLEKINIDIKNDDNFRAYKKQEKKIDEIYPWQPQGAYRDVIAGDFPYGPPSCMCLFQKSKKIIIPCDTMVFPKG